MKTLKEILANHEIELSDHIDDHEWLRRRVNELRSQLCQHRQMELDNIMAEQDAEALDD